MYLTVLHRIDPVTGASSITKPHVSCKKLSGPRYISTLSLASFLAFHCNAPVRSVQAIDVPDADNRPLINAPSSSSLTFIHSTNICCISTMCQEMF